MLNCFWKGKWDEVYFLLTTMIYIFQISHSNRNITFNIYLMKSYVSIYLFEFFRQCYTVFAFLFSPSNLLMYASLLFFKLIHSFFQELLLHTYMNIHICFYFHK